MENPEFHWVAAAASTRWRWRRSYCRDPVALWPCGPVARWMVLSSGLILSDSYIGELQWHWIRRLKDIWKTFEVYLSLDIDIWVWFACKRWGCTEVVLFRWPIEIEIWWNMQTQSTICRFHIEIITETAYFYLCVFSPCPKTGMSQPNVGCRAACQTQNGSVAGMKHSCSYGRNLESTASWWHIGFLK